MVTTIVLLLCFSLAFVAGGFVAFKGVQLGLRWQIEVRSEKPPTLETPNPIAPMVEARQEKVFQKQEAEQTSVISEWLNGPVEK